MIIVIVVDFFSQLDQLGYELMHYFIRALMSTLGIGLKHSPQIFLTSSTFSKECTFLVALASSNTFQLQLGVRKKSSNRDPIQTKCFDMQFLIVRVGLDFKKFKFKLNSLVCEIYFNGFASKSMRFCKPYTYVRKI